MFAFAIRALFKGNPQTSVTPSNTGSNEKEVPLSRVDAPLPMVNGSMPAAVNVPVIPVVIPEGAQPGTSLQVQLSDGRSVRYIDE